MSGYTERLKREAAERAEKERQALKQIGGGQPMQIKPVSDPNQVVQKYTQLMTNETGGVALAVIAFGEHRAVGIAQPNGQPSTPPEVVTLLLDVALRILHQATQPPGHQAAGPRLVDPTAPGTH